MARPGADGGFSVENGAVKFSDFIRGDEKEAVMMDVMDKAKREQLRTLALAATPGEWEQKNTTDVFGPLAGDSGDGTMADSSDGWLIADCNVGLTSVNGELATMDVKIQRRNAAYIAAANPATLLTLLDRIEELEGDAERYRWIRANCLSVTDLAATRIGASDEAIDKARGQ